MAHEHHHHDHAHGHAHGTDIDWAEMAAYLESEAELFTPLYERALAWLGKEVTEPGLIVDAGSGPGVVSCLFAEAFPGARVLAVDGSAPLLERARARAERCGVADRFSTLAGELPEVLDELDYPATCCGPAAACTTSATSAPPWPPSPSGSPPVARWPCWRADCRPATCPATSASAAPVCRPGWTRCWRTASRGCAPTCPAASP